MINEQLVPAVNLWNLCASVDNPVLVQREMEYHP